MLIPDLGFLLFVAITIVVVVALPIMTLVYLWRHAPLARGLTIGRWRAVGVVAFFVLGPLMPPLYWGATLITGRPAPIIAR